MEEELDVNEALGGLNNHTVPIYNFPNPFITCTYIDEVVIFVNLFHSKTATHYHFFYNADTREIFGITKIEMNCSHQNFPVKCFYSSEENEVFSFYRQGDGLRVPCKFIENKMNATKDDYYLEKIHNKDLGEMYLINEKALVTRSSDQILFFKMELDDFTKEKSWCNYFTLDIQGFVYFIKGNKRIQITNDKLIYFYLIDPDTLEPTLENVMYNYMSCSQMMFGSAVRYCITYKTNQKSFDIYRRRYEHDFCVNVY